MKTIKTDIDKIVELGELGKTKLPDKFREQIVTAFNTYPNNWYDPTVLSQVLGVSKAYARRICEDLVMKRIVEKRGNSHRVYYRYRIEERFGL